MSMKVHPADLCIDLLLCMIGRVHFATSRNVNYICYKCNRFGHRSHEWMKKRFQSHDNWCNNYGQHERDDIMSRSQRPAWNQRRSAPASSISLSVLVAGYNNMIKRRRSNWCDGRSSNQLFDMNTVCFYNNASDHVAKFSRERTNEQMKERPAPKTVN